MMWPNIKMAVWIWMVQLILSLTWGNVAPSLAAITPHSTPTLTATPTPTPTPTPTRALRAAVYEHRPHMLPDRKVLVSRQVALAVMRKNLDVYAIQTERARQQGAEIIVFPEDGLYGITFSRKSIFPYLEEIPDPETVSWSPCSDSGRFPDTEVQTALSCMAMHNHVYLVANMGDRVPCNLTSDPQCPPDGHYQYNTDVAYGPDGKLLAKYHKTHLFYEYQFNTPEPKVVSFDTPFGRVGMLVCFDILFKNPAVTMVTEHNISIVAFPTAWMDALPLLSAVGYHSSFARGLGVNFLSANLHIPEFRFHGSGIFTPEGVSSYYYNNEPVSPGKLLVSTIDMVTPAHYNRETHAKDVFSPRYHEDKYAIDLGDPKYGGDKHAMTNGENNLFYLNQSDEFKSDIFHDTFTFRLLEEPSGKLDVCQNKVCCSLEYEFDLADNTHPSGDLFAFGVFDGLHTYEGQYYFQICTLVKCANPEDKFSCGSETKLSTTVFKSFTVSGKFETEFVYPQVILSDAGQLVLAARHAWSFHGNTLHAPEPGMDTPLVSVTLIARDYSRDGGNLKVEDRSHSHQRLPHSETRATSANNGSVRREGTVIRATAIIVMPVLFAIAVHLFL